MGDHTTPPAPASDAVPPTGEVYCPQCGYDLRGRASDRCPECGLPVDDQTLREPQIPWTHRDKIGRWRAYWRTVRLALFHPRKLGGEVARPVNLDDARGFWRVTARFLTVPAAVAATVAYLVSLDPWPRPDSTLAVAGLAFEFLAVASLWPATYLFFLAVMGVGSYLFHPRHLTVVQQNRAIAVSYYGCAGLAWLPGAATLSAGTIVLLSNWWQAADAPVLQVLAFLVIFLPAALVALVWLDMTRLVAAATRCGWGRIIAMALGLPVAWAILFALTVIAIPGIVLYLGLIALSVL